jgi:DNA polymerase III delta prime subunit
MFHKNKKELGAQIFKRLTFILENEGIEYEKEQLQKVILTYYPSVRKMIMVLQQNSTSGKLEISERILNENLVVDEIIGALKKKDFSKVRPLLNELSDPEHLYTMVYSKIDKIVSEKSIPVVIMTTAKYLDMSQRSRDKYITLAAYCAELCLSQQIEYKG